MQKIHLILAKVSKIYQLFKQKHPFNHIGFFEFYMLRLKNCILAGKSKTQTLGYVSVLRHQNIKLIVSEVGLQNVLDSDDTPLK